ncbi:MAG: M56 family metallopeptidase [Erysipelotrichaceae bacterium]
MMERVMLNIINISLSSVPFIVAVLIYRIIFKNSAKWTRMILWALLGFKLIIPFSIESPFGFFENREAVSSSLIDGNSFEVNTQIDVIDNNLNDYIGDHYYQGVSVPADNGINVLNILFIFYLVVVVLISIYSVFSYLRLKSKLKNSIVLEDNVYISSMIESPFVMGYFKPSIYLPFSLDEKVTEYVLKHEKEHIRHHDHIYKITGYILCIVHWFNPFVWFAYQCFSKDIELCCDERVIKNMDSLDKADYSTVLLNLSIRKNSFISPLAFGENDVKGRIKAIMKYKKTSVWIITLSIVLIIFLGIGFITERKQSLEIEIEVPDTNGETLYFEYEYKLKADGYKAYITSYYGGDMEAVISSGVKEYGVYLTRGYKAEIDTVKDDVFTLGISINSPHAETVRLKIEGVSLDSRKSDSIDLKIISIDENCLYCEDEKGNEVEVNVSNTDGFKPLDIIRVSYDEMLETYPLRINKIYLIEVIENKLINLFRSNSELKDVTVSDYVYASDEAYGLIGIVQYEDGSSWNLAFVSEDTVQIVRADFNEEFSISSKLKYLGNGTVAVMVDNGKLFYNCTMAYSKDEEGIHFVRNDEMYRDMSLSYHLVIGSDNVNSVSILLNDESHGITRGDGKAFEFGERIHLDCLDGLVNLSGVQIEAYDSEGNTVFKRIIETDESMKWGNWEIWTMVVD